MTRIAILCLTSCLTVSACLEERAGSRLDTARDALADEMEAPDDLEGDTAHTDEADTGEAARDIDVAPAETVVPEDTEVPPPCPIAVIDVAPGSQVEPLTLLQLDGSRSHSAGGPVTGYRWELGQPVDSAAVFVPSAGVATPRLEANVAGVYTVRLHVVDARGTRSCVPAELAIFVDPTAALHIELTWRATPPPAGGGDETGPDLDLHFAHPFAFAEGRDGARGGEGWFDRTFDVFWYNPAPNWGRLAPDANDDPRLLREGNGGNGPEVIAHDHPEAGSTYRVGVHLWSDHGYRDVRATLRIYVFGSLVFHVADVPMRPLDFWTAAYIDWRDDAPPRLELVRRCRNTGALCASDAECGGEPCTYDLAPSSPPSFFGTP